jgi:hypothetical protein
MPSEYFLRNLTLHRQTEQEIRLAREAGFELGTDPEGVLVQAGPDGLRSSTDQLVTKLCRVREQGEAALVGGHTALWVAAVMQLVRGGGPLPELYYFDTRRVRDENDRWLFAPAGLFPIPVPTGREDTE